ncbi:hypothetical protein NHQ30_010078 [Ciborinia camelliae]|nr:hypothetical protein NHQ30_010078 [Ciborinia camelliae]
MYQLQYRPLDRTKNEFRLLKILPPACIIPKSSDPLKFSSEPIYCQLQYDYIPVIDSQVSIRKRDLGAKMLKVLSDRRIRSQLPIDKKNLNEFNKDRKEVLHELHKISQQVMRGWGPENNSLEVYNFREKSFEEWLRTWIWTPLTDNNNHIRQHSLSYFALSYVSHDKPQLTLSRTTLGTELIDGSGVRKARSLLLEGLNKMPDNIDEACGKSDNVAEFVKIFVDDIPVLVSKNLEKALRTMREIPEIASGTRIWVDALCINQKDTKERSFEVKRMGEIYRNADRVISFLGEESDQSGHILEFLDNIGEEVRRTRKQFPPVIFEGPKRREKISVLAKLVDRNYFSHIWIIQEVIQGGDKSVLICGARKFSWINLLKFGEACSESWGPETEISDELMEGTIKLNYLAYLYHYFREYCDEDRTSLVKNPPWFRIASSHQATDSRDLIYGMMSLLPKKLSDLINVDYASHNRFVDVMRTFAEAYMKSTQSLNWILHRYYIPFIGHRDWPTWVPNLAQQAEAATWDWPINTKDSACPNIPCKFSVEMHEETGRHLLICQGMYVDVIDMAAENVSTIALRKRKAMAKTLNLIFAEKSGQIDPITLKKKYANLETIVRSIERQESFIITDSDESDEDMLQPYRNHEMKGARTHRYHNVGGLIVALHSCFSFMDLYPIREYNIFYYPPNGSEITERPLQQNILKAFLRTEVPYSFYDFEWLRDPFSSFKLWNTTFRDLFPIEDVVYNRAQPRRMLGEASKAVLGRLFTTMNGYVGVTFGNVRSGDEVWLLAGCQKPVLLRKSKKVEGSYELLGGVHIPGIMKGEALWGTERHEFERVSIC